ncbi:hypothetical protein BDR05DRAFT_506044 [Suillus weaverae]|nr:hypothetical protein BDR05DRAFT_506044 [Suillus weaverae]
MNQDQCHCFHPLSLSRSLTSSTVTWERLSHVAVKGAEYDSRERQPHPKCLKGTRVDLLDYIHVLLNNREKNQLIWLHGTAGVGKSAVAFTVAERMRGLKMSEQTNIEKRLAGTFFFSRKHTERCTTGYFFATLVYQLASNFPSIREDVNRFIRENPSLLDPNKSLRDQMEVLFLQPLRKLRFRLRGCEPLTFIVDALDECTSNAELTDLILFLALALREPDLPVTHILFTSRSESHICKAFQNEEVRPLVCEIPVRTSGEGVASIISLDGADVDNDIYIFLRHSFAELESRHPDFPQPSKDELEQLASRAGRRFIVASTMMTFIDDEDNDPYDRLQLMLQLTSELLPGTEVYKLYDSILSTCADPKRAYLHLSVVAALADPLPMSQISILLGPGLGGDVETVLMQLRSVMDIPTDRNFPVNIYHSSVRDYVSDPSNCSLSHVHDIPSPHSLLAVSSFRLMMKMKKEKEVPERTALPDPLSQKITERTTLLDALSKLKKHSQTTQPHDPQRLKDSLAFFVQPPEPLSVLIGILWLRGDHSSELRSWLETLDGCAWLEMQEGDDWLGTQGGDDWLNTQGGRDWLHTRYGEDWLHTQSGRGWLHKQHVRRWLHTLDRSGTLQTQRGRDWLQAQEHGRLVTRSRQDSPEARHRDWPQTQGSQDWLQTTGVQDWLPTPGGRSWLQTQLMRAWLQTRGVKPWLQTQGGRDWLQTRSGRTWLQTPGGLAWLQAPSGRDWLQTQGGLDWLQIPCGRDWLQTPRGQDWLQIPRGQDWLQAHSGQDWLQTTGGQEWLQTPRGRDWLQTPHGRDWLQTPRGQDWLQTPNGQAWQCTPAASFWLTMEEFTSISETISDHVVVPELSELPAFQVLQQFKSLPDFLIFPTFLALRRQDRSTFTLPEGLLLPDREIIHAMKALITFANEEQELIRLSSDALKLSGIIISSSGSKGSGV